MAIDGRSSPLFAFRLLQRRHRWMLAFGAAHALLLWFGDIVGAYGLAGLLVTRLLLERSDRTLRTIGWGMVGVLALFGAVGKRSLSSYLLQSALFAPRCSRRSAPPRTASASGSSRSWSPRCSIAQAGTAPPRRCCVASPSGSGLSRPRRPCSERRGATT